MRNRAGGVGVLLFGSGFCALIYQTVWLREFRLIFGASTLASAAVLAIFMGGLGLGGVIIGRRVDRSANPLFVYGSLELGVAAFSAITPLLLWLVRHLYLALGGSFAMGQTLATIVRLLLSVVVLGVPTFLMGGTLPAAARSVEHSGDPGRLGVSILYGTNTVGAVTGALVSTFWILETFGNLKTLFASALLNTLVGLAALAYSNALRAPQGKSRSLRDEIEEEPQGGAGDVTTPASAALAPKRLVYVAAAAVGFAFFLMELVWYRMLTPLLGGTTYTFGLILAVALAGIGAGSLGYAVARRSRGTTGAFALLCALEALTMAVPFALGDRIASLALFLRPLGTIGFFGFILGWSLVAAVVIFLPAFIAGVQFPLLISLLGAGRKEVGRHIGAAYLWNTVGAIAGSIAGGFGGLPLLGASGVWRGAVVILAALVLLTMIWGGARRATGFAAFTTAAAAVALLFAGGPTAFWRHSPIGAGRVDIGRLSRNSLIDFQNTRRRTTIWEADGIESSVSIADSDGYAFIVNGKSDGHARLDAGTQIMGGILPALLHPNPRRAAIVGLGTGTTAGWLASVPSVERVDVVEIEPAIVHVADVCSVVNRDVMHNPKAHVLIGDGREFLLARGDKFDIISSEPSNPYRAGIGNLFTTDFYFAAASRLAPGGMFVQFLQAYEVDAPTIRTIYATITRVFPEVETWQTAGGDLLLVASMQPLAHDWRRVEQRIASEPFHSAIRNAWAVNDAAGVFARYVCGTETARRLATAANLNTDDRAVVEYAFARTLGVKGAFDVAELRAFARSRADDLPQDVRAIPDAVRVEQERLSIGIVHETKIDIHELLPQDLRARGAAQFQYMEGDYAGEWTIWKGQRTPPQTPLEMISYAEAVAGRGDEEAVRYIEALRPEFPFEAEVLMARLRWREGKLGEGVVMLARAFERCRIDPWALPVTLKRAIGMAVDMGQDPQFAAVGRPLVESLKQPFSTGVADEQRKSALMFLTERIAGGACSPEFVEAIRLYEPNVPWQGLYLQKRARCYEETGDPRASRARRDLADFQKNEPRSLAQWP